MSRSGSRIRRTAGTAAALLSGPLLAVGIFITFWGLIPQSITQLLASLTLLLALTLGAAVAAFRSRPAGLAALPLWLRRGAALGLPTGLVLLVGCQMAFVRQVQGVGSPEVVALPRPASCPYCQADLDDAQCLRLVGADPTRIERCWGSFKVRRNRLFWSSSFLLSAGGLLSLVVLTWCRSPEQPRPLEPEERRETRRGLFLSYAGEDEEFAERLARDIAARGIPVWWDRWDVKTGDSLPRSVVKAIAGSRWLGIILSPDAVKSRWVSFELDIALTLEIKGEGITILPILLRPCEVPSSLVHKRRTDFTTSSYDKGLEEVLRSLGLEPAENAVAGASPG
jgi:hypothetical protein